MTYFGKSRTESEKSHEAAGASCRSVLQEREHFGEDSGKPEASEGNMDGITAENRKERDEWQPEAIQFSSV